MAVKAVVFDMYETLITQYRSPIYFSPDMAKDAGVNVEYFKRMWDATDTDRTLGKTNLQKVVAEIMESAGCYTDEKLEKIYKSRLGAKAGQFLVLHEEIIPMLEKLKEMNIKIGLISNCFEEEVKVIKESNLYKYFDVCILSSEVGIKKPDLEIFKLGIKRLEVMADEILYVGDGGSNELIGAKMIGMRPLQACWYISEWQSDYRIDEFEMLNVPNDIFLYI